MARPRGVTSSGGAAAVPDEAREAIPAAAKAIHDEAPARCNHDALGDDCRYLAAAALTAAWPSVRAAVLREAAEQITRERIPWSPYPDWMRGYIDGQDKAVQTLAALAAGGSPVPEGDKR